MRFTGTSAADCRAWQDAFAAKLRSLLGPHQPPSDWKPVLEASVTRDDHVREQWLLTADGVDSVPVYLLRPKTETKGKTLPGIMAVHGHGSFGNDPVAGVDDTPALRNAISSCQYDYGRQLVRRGYVVAAPCLTPFGRRLTGGHANTRQGDACGAAFISLQLLGRLLMADNLRDILWSIEFLASREGVDRERLGCVGLSYGGRMTMLTAALEPRIKVAAVSGALNCLQERVATGHSAGCQVIPNLLAFGDVPEIGSLIAPRPCVWEVGTRDGLIAPEWAETALTRLRKAYHAFGAEHALQVDRFDGGHEWHGAMAYPLLDRILKP